jgi:general secretion pathway protein J
MKASARSDRPRRQRRSAGFTLIELMVAMAILAIVALLAWRGLNQVIRGRDSVVRAMDEERALGQVFGQIHTDLLHAARDDDIDAPAVRNQPGLLELVREIDLPGQGAGLQVVRYTLNNGQLWRDASPTLLRSGELRAALSADADLTRWNRVELMDGVRGGGIELYLHDHGWTSSMDAVRHSYDDNLKQTTPGQTNGPLLRSATGVELKLWLQGRANPYDRVFMIGE